MDNLRTGINYVTTRLLNKNSHKLTTRQPGDERDVWEKVADFLEEQGLLRDKTADDKVQQYLREARIASDQARAAQAYAHEIARIARTAANSLPDSPQKDRAKRRLEEAKHTYQMHLQQASRDGQPAA